MHESVLVVQPCMKEDVTSVSIYMAMFCNGSFITVCSTVELNAKHKIKRKTLNEKELNGKYKLKKKKEKIKGSCCGREMAVFSAAAEKWGTSRSTRRAIYPRLVLPTESKASPARTLDIGHVERL